MRDAAAIIAPSIDVQQLAREIAKAHVEYQDGERALASAEKKTESIREEQARRRVEMGRMLIEARASVGKRGGWIAYLEKLGIDRKNAHNWMQLAGYVDDLVCETSPPVSHTPTLADAGVDKRPRKRDAEPAEFHILIDSGKFKEKVRSAAEQWPAESRRSIPTLLRDLADEIEREYQ